MFKRGQLLSMWKLSMIFQAYTMVREPSPALHIQSPFLNKLYPNPWSLLLQLAIWSSIYLIMKSVWLVPALYFISSWYNLTISLVTLCLLGNMMTSCPYLSNNFITSLHLHQEKIYYWPANVFLSSELYTLPEKPHIVHSLLTNIFSEYQILW